MDLKALSSPGNTRTAVNMSCDTDPGWCELGGCITTTSVLLFSHPLDPLILRLKHHLEEEFRIFHHMEKLWTCCPQASHQ